MNGGSAYFNLSPRSHVTVPALRFPDGHFSMSPFSLRLLLKSSAGLFCESINATDRQKSRSCNTSNVCSIYISHDLNNWQASLLARSLLARRLLLSTYVYALKSLVLPKESSSSSYLLFACSLLHGWIIDIDLRYAFVWKQWQKFSWWKSCCLYE